MTTSKVRTELATIIDAALDDLLTTSDAQLRIEVQEDAEDPGTVSQQMKWSMREAAAATLRQRLAVGKAKSSAGSRRQVQSTIRPSLDRIKSIVQEVFRSDASLGLAFRGGKHQTEADWQSLYDDLVSMGAIDPNADGH